MKILVTGATGYIGSHTCVELLNAGYDVVGIDNFINSKPDVLDKIKRIWGKGIKFYEGDVTFADVLQSVFTEHKIDAAIHFAGLKAVGESVAKPLEYYRNNLLSTMNIPVRRSRLSGHKETAWPEQGNHQYLLLA